MYEDKISKEIDILEKTSIKNSEMLSRQGDKIINIEKNNIIIHNNLNKINYSLNRFKHSFKKIYDFLMSKKKKNCYNVLETQDQEQNTSDNITFSVQKNPNDINYNLNTIIEIQKTIGSKLDEQNDNLNTISDLFDSNKTKLNHSKAKVESYLKK